MWHTLQRVAESRFLNEEAFTKFVEKNTEKYGIDQYGMIGTWYVDSAVQDFKATK